MWGDSISTVGDRISTAEAIQYCGVKFLIFLYLVDIANQKLSAVYNFETKIVLDFYRNWQLRRVWGWSKRSRHFLFSVFLNYQNGGISSKMRMFGYLRYCEYFFSDFYKSDFSIFCCSQIRKLGLQKSEIFRHLFDIHLQSNTKTWSSKIRDFNTNIPLVDICL